MSGHLGGGSRRDRGDGARGVAPRDGGVRSRATNSLGALASWHWAD